MLGGDACIFCSRKRTIASKGEELVDVGMGMWLMAAPAESAMRFVRSKVWQKGASEAASEVAAGAGFERSGSAGPTVSNKEAEERIQSVM